MKTVTLYCQLGKHDWERESQRGRKPTACPDHREPVAAPIAVRPTSAERSRPNQTERALVAPTSEAERAEKKRAADVRIDNLEMLLKASGLHISQHA